VDARGRAEEEEAARLSARELAERRKAQRERKLDLGDRLIQRAQEMLALPVVERDADCGKVTQHVHPAKWRLADAARVAEAGVSLRRAALEMDGPGDAGRELGDLLAEAFARMAGARPSPPAEVAGLADPAAARGNGHANGVGGG
jgi:hypothetical protein